MGNNAAVASVFSAKRTGQQLKALWEKGKQQAKPYWDFGYPLMTQAFPQLQSGIVYAVAPENVGKSQALVNVGYSVLAHNPDAYWLDFSLDDSMEGRYGYLLACAGMMPINLAHQAADATVEEQELRQKAFTQFQQQYGGRYRLEAVSELDATEDELQYSAEWITERVHEARQELGPEPKLFVTVDGFHDVTLDARCEDEVERQKRKSRLFKQCAPRDNVCYFMTAQARQDSRKRALAPDIFKGELSPVYDAKAIIHLYSDLNLNRDQATIFWEDEDLPGIQQPVLEFDVQKNKVGSFKGVLFYNFLPGKCQLFEPDAAEQQLYRNSLFKSESKKKHD